VNIPIENIYYLLCYAWDCLEEKDVVDVRALDSTSLADLFARVLTNGIRHLLRRGLDRGYVAYDEWTSRPRGRIHVQDLVARAGSRTGRLPCSYDELSYDVLHNRILKATMRRLLRARALAPETAEPLAHILNMFDEVTDVELSSQTFGQVQLHRNNHFYDFLLKVCELIHSETFVSEESGQSSFLDFVRDHQQMAGLYEDFIRNFYRHEVKELRTAREDIRWKWMPKDTVAAGLLPKMQTDVSLSSAHGKMIIECKYTPEATKRHYDAEKLRAGHLYQLSAYMQNLVGPGSDGCRMMLLYPTVDSAISADYAHEGNTISIRTINLNQPWRGIDRDLRELVREISPSAFDDAR
jgi:5-methylcytosine-specific restriction enzyme subunit McrC